MVQAHRLARVTGQTNAVAKRDCGPGARRQCIWRKIDQRFLRRRDDLSRFFAEEGNSGQLSGQFAAQSLLFRGWV
jgi:hypothetical protein